MPLVSAKELQEEFGILELGFSMEDEPERLKTFLDAKLQDAEDEIGNTAPSLLNLLTSSTRTAAQTRILIRAQKLLAMSMVLERPEVLKVLGTHEPLAMEESGNMADLADRFWNRASGLIGNLRDALASAPISATPFARPVFRAGTFTPSITDRPPSARNSLLDETDDIGSWNTELG